MKLYFACEGRFIKKGTTIYSESSGFTNKIWQRYLKVFDSLIIVARVKHDEQYISDEALIANSEKVSFLELPYYVGPLGYLKIKNKLDKIISQNIDREAAYICRLPGKIGGALAKNLNVKKIPYGVEVVGDPWDVFAPGSIKHPLSPFLRIIETLNLKKNVKKASSVIYVTKETLQNRYPAKKNAFTTFASDVEIDSKELSAQAHVWSDKESYNLISVGSLAQMYKAPDIVIKSLYLLKQKGINVRLTWLGDGMYKSEMQMLAKSLGVADMVYFAGNVTLIEVKKHLNQSDLFILVSRTEGLPRAIVEAMSIGLPCIGSNVGGIPELLDKAALIPKNDENSLASKIELFLKHEDVFNKQAIRNFEEAKEYDNELLSEKRETFYYSLLKS